jgi:PTH1 family peptidyl-tRNA hydrolase
MWLLCGLGNPGKKYAGNRHNAGFMVVDEFSRRHNLGDYRDKFGASYASGQVAGQKGHVLKPMEFMNHSGFAVSRAAQYLGVAPANIVVIHDEADLPFGRLKVKVGGGHGGHNGVRSIIEQLGQNDFLRVRVGVGKPPNTQGAGPTDKRVANYLLSDFSATEAGERDALIARAASATEAIMECGAREAMNRFNGDDKNEVSS